MNTSLVKYTFDYLAYSADNTQDEAEINAKSGSLNPQYFVCHCFF